MGQVGQELLADYIGRAELARQLGCSGRTIARYERERDGLSVTIIGGRKLYRIADVQAWLLRRERVDAPPAAPSPPRRISGT